MTVFLAIDTATERGSVAVGEDGKPLAEIGLAPRRHAGTLVPAARECLDMAGVGLGEIGGFLVADGPGSFTGLRIGFATIAGFAAERAGSVATAPSLMSAAFDAWDGTDAPVASLYDALRGDVYAAVYSFTPTEVIVHCPPNLTLARSLPTLAGTIPRLAVGDGAMAHAGVVRRWTGRDPLGSPRGLPRAGHLFALHRLRGATRVIEDLTTFEPAYGRLAEAQVRWEREHGRPLRDPDRDTE